MIFYVVLPPFLFDAAWNTSIPDFKRLLKNIFAGGGGLVFITTTSCTVVAHEYYSPVYLAAGFYIGGAIISPPDAVAATSITRDLPLLKN